MHSSNRTPKTKTNGNNIKSVQRVPEVFERAEAETVAAPLLAADSPKAQLGVVVVFVERVQVFRIVVDGRRGLFGCDRHFFPIGSEALDDLCVFHHDDDRETSRRV